MRGGQDPRLVSVCVLAISLGSADSLFAYDDGDPMLVIADTVAVRPPLSVTVSVTG